MTKAELKEIAAKYADDYEVVGIRTQEVPFELGKVYHDSHIWDDGDDTGDELNGICCTDWQAPEVTEHVEGNYPGEHIAIIAGYNYSYGQDLGELIIHDATVVEIIK